MRPTILSEFKIALKQVWEVINADADSGGKH